MSRKCSCSSVLKKSSWRSLSKCNVSWSFKSFAHFDFMNDMFKEYLLGVGFLFQGFGPSFRVHSSSKPIQNTYKAHTLFVSLIHCPLGFLMGRWTHLRCCNIFHLIVYDTLIVSFSGSTVWPRHFRNDNIYQQWYGVVIEGNIKEKLIFWPNKNERNHLYILMFKYDIRDLLQPYTYLFNTIFKLFVIESMNFFCFSSKLIARKPAISTTKASIYVCVTEFFFL